MFNVQYKSEIAKVQNLNINFVNVHLFVMWNILYILKAKRANWSLYFQDLLKFLESYQNRVHQKMEIKVMKRIFRCVNFPLNSITVWCYVCWWIDLLVWDLGRGTYSSTLTDTNYVHVKIKKNFSAFRQFISISLDLLI